MRSASSPDDAALARIDPARTIERAQSVLRDEQVLSDEQATPESRVTALFTLGCTYADQNQPQQATPILEELVQARLYSEDWYILSRCYDQLGDVDRAVQAAERAAEISPQYPQLQLHLARLAEKQGDDQRAQEHLRRADQLAQAEGLSRQPSGE